MGLWRTIINRFMGFQQPKKKPRTFVPTVPKDLAKSVDASKGNPHADSRSASPGSGRS